MNRRDWLRHASVVAAGVIAVDQLELLERLSHKKVFAGADFADPFAVDRTMFYLRHYYLDGGHDTYIWEVGPVVQARQEMMNDVLFSPHQRLFTRS